jgi:hypothetical protein
MSRLQFLVLLVVCVAPSWAQDKGQSSSSPSKPSARAAASPAEAGVIVGAINDGVYRNAAFGFSYKLPFGWVDRTANMQDDSAAASTSRVLLALFERPPEASGDTINSAVVIAAEPLFGGIKTAAEYFQSLSAPTIAKGFQAGEEPHDFSVGTTKLVRGDFSKARGQVTVRQTSLVVLQKGYAVSFTFIGGSADEVNELIEKLTFAARKR